MEEDRLEELKGKSHDVVFPMSSALGFGLLHSRRGGGAPSLIFSCCIPTKGLCCSSRWDGLIPAGCSVTAGALGVVVLGLKQSWQRSLPAGPP